MALRRAQAKSPRLHPPPQTGFGAAGVIRARQGGSESNIYSRTPESMAIGSTCRLTFFLYLFEDHRFSARLLSDNRVFPRTRGVCRVSANTGPAKGRQTIRAIKSRRSARHPTETAMAPSTPIAVNDHAAHTVRAVPHLHVGQRPGSAHTHPEVGTRNFAEHVADQRKDNEEPRQERPGPGRGLPVDRCPNE